jgi:nitroimidazol reductase NimA-like FMN-containing flavoprotein (pyridoxamine 5'-phosphate oxidase superfamily)
MIELTRDEIDRFLDEQTVGRIGCHDDEGTYVVPSSTRAKATHSSC